jgi:LysM repeat protein
VILDHGRLDLRLLAFRPDRVSGQGILVGLLGLAFVAVLVARPQSDGRATGEVSGISASAVPTPAASTGASPTSVPAVHASPAPVITARPVASPAPSVEAVVPSAAASATPKSPGTTYKVKSGDTLTAIARRNGTTVKVLMSLNGITDPSKLKIGQVLQLP